MKCLDCNKEMKLVVENRRYKESGLDNITLIDIKKYVCNSCGEEYIGIPNAMDLHRLIANTLIQNPKRLSGKEFRFLRKSLGYSGEFFAKIVGVSRETISRWENEKLSLPKHMDLLMRSLVVNNEPDRNYDFHDLILKNKGQKFTRFKIGIKRSGEWEVKEAA